MAYNSLSLGARYVKSYCRTMLLKRKTANINGKNQWFPNVVRANAVTPSKRQISKVVTIPVADPVIIRPIIVPFEALPHTNALTSEHT
jgi:hypothetical protein